MIFQDVTRGGQTSLHMLRMLKQVAFVSVVAALLLGFSVLVTYSYKNIPRALWINGVDYTIAKYNILIAPRDKEHKFTQTYRSKNGVEYIRTSISILSDPKIRADIFRLKIRFTKALKISSITCAGSFIIILGLWSYIGNKHRRKKHERGGTFLEVKELKGLLKSKNIDSKLYLDELPLIKDKETSHILITGTTGSGKSNCFNTILPQIRLQNQKVVIIDLTGDYISRFYNERTDIILNPFDIRSAKWHIWSECDSLAQYDTLASTLIQDNKNNDDFWVNNSRTLFTTAAIKLKEAGITSTKELLNILIIKNLKDIQAFFKNTKAAPLISDQNEKTSISIRATLAASLKALEYLDDTTESFSIKSWIQNQENNNSWLFLTARADQRETLKPLLSCFMNTAINGLMTLEPNLERRVWFVIDELAALNKLSSLTTMLAEGRKYGGCVLVGTQSVPQINEIYGHNAAQSLLDLFNTRIFFRTLDPNTALWVSKSLGEAEQTESIENTSYGAHEMRDGVSLSRLTKTKPLIIPTELSKLEDLEAYIQLPGVPITKMKFLYKSLTQIAKGFILKDNTEIKRNDSRELSSSANIFELTHTKTIQESIPLDLATNNRDQSYEG